MAAMTSHANGLQGLPKSTFEKCSFVVKRALSSLVVIPLEI